MVFIRKYVVLDIKERTMQNKCNKTIIGHNIIISTISLRRSTKIVTEFFKIVVVLYDNISAHKNPLTLNYLKFHIYWVHGAHTDILIEQPAQCQGTVEKLLRAEAPAPLTSIFSDRISALAQQQSSRISVKGKIIKHGRGGHTMCLSRRNHSGTNR